MTICNAIARLRTPPVSKVGGKRPFLVLRAFGFFGVVTADLTGDVREPETLSWHRTERDAETEIQRLIDEANGVPRKPGYKLAVGDD